MSASAAGPLAPVAPIPDEDSGLIWTGPSPHSGHGIDAFTHCPQYWRYRYGAEASAVGSDADAKALVRGTLLHVGLAHLYARQQARQRGADPAAFHPPVAAIRAHASERSPTWEANVDTVLWTLEAYRRRWAEEDAGFVVLGVERTFPLDGLPLPHTRSEDWVVLDGAGSLGPPGLVYFMDHKSTGRLTDDTVQQYALDGTFLDAELIGRRTFGRRWGGAVLNLIEVKDRPGEPIRALRAPVAPSPWALADRLDRLRGEYERLRGEIGVELLGRDPFRWPKSTTGKSCRPTFTRLCAGFDLCRLGPSVGDRARLGPLRDAWLAAAGGGAGEGAGGDVCAGKRAAPVDEAV